MNEILTEKQKAVLDFIGEYQLKWGKSPTIKEMRLNFKVNSDNSILKHLKALNEKGFIEKDDTPRGIKLLQSVRQRFENAQDSIQLPVFGFIPAGSAVDTEQHASDWITVSSDLAKNSRDFFILQVTGNSMLDAGIFEEDLVVVNKAKEPKVGDIVVALVDGGNTLKRLVKENGEYFLKAENPDYQNIHPLGALEVQGVVTALIRKYI